MHLKKYSIYLKANINIVKIFQYVIEKNDNRYFWLLQLQKIKPTHSFLMQPVVCS